LGEITIRCFCGGDVDGHVDAAATAPEANLARRKKKSGIERERKRIESGGVRGVG